MDKQGRLTKLAEWKVGQRYRWLKGGRLGAIATCTEIRNATVQLQYFGYVVEEGPKQWRNRWKPFDGVKN
jgi:hypothetical protein